MVTIDFAAETVNDASDYEVCSKQTGGMAINDKDSIEDYIPDALLIPVAPACQPYGNLALLYISEHGR